MKVTIIFEYLLAVSPNFARDKMTTTKMRCYVYRPTLVLVYLGSRENRQRFCTSLRELMRPG